MPFLLAVFLASPFSMAIETKDCPLRIPLNFGKLTAYSDAFLQKQLDEGTPGESSELKSIRDAFKTLESKELTLNLQLAQRKSGICEYSSDGKIAPQGLETRFATLNGKAVLRVALPLPDSAFGTSTFAGRPVVWVYYQVMSYDAGMLQLMNEKGRVFGYFDHGAPRVKVGNLESVWVNGEEPKEVFTYICKPTLKNKTDAFLADAYSELTVSGSQLRWQIYENESAKKPAEPRIDWSYLDSGETVKTGPAKNMIKFKLEYTAKENGESVYELNVDHALLRGGDKIIGGDKLGGRIAFSRTVLAGHGDSLDWNLCTRK